MTFFTFTFPLRTVKLEEGSTINQLVTELLGEYENSNSIFSMQFSNLKCSINSVLSTALYWVGWIYKESLNELFK